MNLSLGLGGLLDFVLIGWSGTSWTSSLNFLQIISDSMGSWLNRSIFDTELGSEEFDSVLGEGIVIVSPVKDNSDKSFG